MMFEVLLVVKNPERLQFAAAPRIALVSFSMLFWLCVNTVTTLFSSYSWGSFLVNYRYQFLLVYLFTLAPPVSFVVDDDAASDICAWGKVKSYKSQWQDTNTHLAPSGIKTKKETKVSALSVTAAVGVSLDGNQDKGKTPQPPGDHNPAVYPKKKKKMLDTYPVLKTLIAHQPKKHRLESVD